MNYYDEGRPRVNYRPAYIDSHGHGIAPLPSLTVLPLLSGGYRVGVWLRISFNSAQQFYCEVTTLEDLGVLLDTFRLDPEQTLSKMFHYTGMEGTSHTITAPAKPTLRLSDIGL